MRRFVTTWGGVWCVLALAAPAFGADERPAKAFPLWPEGAVPGALGKADKDTPTLTPYWPDPAKATGAAVIVCPGGGYNTLAAHEGEPFAKWLNDLGVTAFVLKYRLVKDGYTVPVILQDAARAVRTVRANAKAWGLDAKKIGVIGSSAGGHLCATLSTRFDAGKPDDADPIERVSSRPDATILCYAFILLDRTCQNRITNCFRGLILMFTNNVFDLKSILLVAAIVNPVCIQKEDVSGIHQLDIRNFR